MSVAETTSLAGCTRKGNREPRYVALFHDDLNGMIANDSSETESENLHQGDTVVLVKCIEYPLLTPLAERLNSKAAFTKLSVLLPRLRP